MSSPQTPTTAKPPIVRILSAFLLPLFFVVVFPLAYISATHAPSPHDFRLAVVGPDQVVGKIASNLDDTDEFDVTLQTDVASAARAAVAERKAEGAIRVDVATASTDAAPAGTKADPADATPSFAVTAYVASAEGRATSPVVTATAEKIAKQLGATVKTVDVAPLGDKDALGTDLFYFFIYTSLAGYLVVIVLMQVAPRTKIGTRFAIGGIASVVAPLLVFGLSSIFVGDYGASFGTISALLGVDALYIFTVSSLAILLQQFLGNAVTFGVMAFIVFLNFPSSGGATPASMLPGFWQGVHQVYFGAGAFESFRSLVYFGGHGFLRWFPQMLAWTGGLVLAGLLVDRIRTVRSLRADLAEARRPQHRHLQVQGAPRPHTDDAREPERSSITTGAEATAR